MLHIKKLSETATVPTRGSRLAAGLDLYADQDATIHDFMVTAVGTGLAVEIPEGYFGMICSRSGMVSKHGLIVANQPGIVDSDYRGEVKVLMTCIYGHRDVNKGERIAQMLIMPYLDVDCEEVKELSNTCRGANGFGSTGK